MHYSNYLNFQIKNEIQCQIDKFRELTGYTPINVDGHQHVHIVPGGLVSICKLDSGLLFHMGN